MNVETIEKECSVHGYHVYGNMIWDTSIRGNLLAVKFSTFSTTFPFSPQVQHMHYGFVNLSNGVRTPSTSSLNGSAAVAPMHTRAGSAPVQTGLPVARYQHQPGARRVLTPPLRATDLLDPLVEFTPGQLNPENYRMSVAW